MAPYPTGAPPSSPHGEPDAERTSSITIAHTPEGPSVAVTSVLNQVGRRRLGEILRWLAQGEHRQLRVHLDFAQAVDVALLQLLCETRLQSRGGLVVTAESADQRLPLALIGLGETSGWPREPEYPALELVRDEPAHRSVAGEPGIVRGLEAMALLGTDPDPHRLGTAQGMVTLACTLIGCDQSGLVAREAHGRLSGLAATGGESRDVERWQCWHHEGPSPEAATATEVVLVDDAVEDPRWPAWGSQMRRLGLRSALAVPLVVGRHHLGALTFYDTRPAAFTDRDRQRAALLAEHAAASLWSVGERENLRIALESRTRIGQAQGILMARHALDAVQAFALLRRLSQESNTKLYDLASKIVTQRGLPPI